MIVAGVCARPASAETRITASEITTNTTWTAAGSPFVIEPSKLIVRSGATLTIEPGVTVELNPKGEKNTGRIEIQGTIRAIGSASSPILLTSTRAAKGEGAPGQWWGVQVESGNSSSQFSYVDVLDGGFVGGSCRAEGELEISKASTVSVEHSVFEGSAAAAVEIGEGTATVSESKFAHNCVGLSADGGTPGNVQMNVSHSSIVENTLEGLQGGYGAWFSGFEHSTSSSFSNDTIRGNRNEGIEVLAECTQPLSSYPHGEHNNIYENNFSKKFEGQLETLKKCKPPLEVNWRNNYWGSVYFYENPSQCASTETPYKGHLAYTWAQPELFPWKIPLGPIYGNEATHGSEKPPFACAWDTFLVEEPLSEPVSSAGYPGEAAQPELVPSELRGDHSVAAPALRDCMRRDPVNCATGNLYETYTDLSVPGLNGGLTLTRSYNSQAAASASSPGPLGYGWTFQFAASLSVDPNSKHVTVTNANGATVAFTPTTGGNYTAAPWVQAKLVLNGEGDYLYTLPDQRVLTFNGSGQLLKVTDRNGNATTLSYGSGRLESVADPAGHKLTFAYNAEGLIESVKDPMGQVVKYAYEGSNLTSVTEPGEPSPRWQYKYDPSHQLTEMTDGRSGKTTNKYDTSNRVTEQKDPLGRTATWSYEAGETKFTDPTGSVTAIQFAGLQPTSITRGAGTSSATTESFVLDASDNVLGVTDGNGHTTKYEYDGEDNRTKMLDADEHETKWTYDSTHDVLTVTTPKGETTTIKRDSHGNAEAIERPAPGGRTQVTKYKYDSHGDLESATDPLERTSRYEYDSYGDRTAEIDPAGDKRTWKYDEDSHETSTVSPRGNVEGAEAAKFTTKIELDAQERPTKVTDPLGHETKYVYDGDGNLERLTDANGHTTTYTYDADNEPTKVEAPNKAITETEYDGDGRVKSQTDGNKHSTKYERNALGQVTEVIDPLSRKTSKEYDRAGNLTKLTDPAKRSTTYAYDAANLHTKITYSDGKTAPVEYEYDKDGERTKMLDGTGTSVYTYDQLDRLTESENGHKEAVKYEYDLANEQIKLTYPNGKTVTRSYDKAARLEKVTDWSEHATTFAYDPDSNQTSTTWPSGTSGEDKYAFNEADQLTQTEMKKGAELLASLSYTRDNDGQLKTTKQTGLPSEAETSYTYDETNRLTKAGTTAYEYDAANNATKTGSSTNTYDAADELEKGTGVSYSYDELGERTKRTPTSGAATTYAYDQAGDLTSVTRPKEGKTAAIADTYAYDGNGLRASQTILGTTSYLAWDVAESLPLALADGTNSYIYGPGGVPVEQVSSGGSVSYLHHDQQGSTRLVTSSSGAKEATFTYDAYGNTTGTTGTAKTPLGYDGQYTSSDTGLIYLRARSYDPATAQFMSVDPLASVTGAPYNYAYDNPANAGDPTGLDVFEDIGNGLAGGADTITGGLSTEAVEEFGIHPDTCSVSFQAGAILGYAGLVIPGVGEEEVTALGARGVLRRLLGRLSDESGAFRPFGSRPTPLTNAQATDLARWNSFTPTNQTLRGQTIFRSSNRYIVQDIDSHAGGIWKMAGSPRALGSSSTRMGTYDAELNRIGP
jgi:RHS repeat-associated protein